MMATPNTSKLDELLKPHQEEFNVLQEALKEVSKEDAESRKGKAKEMIRKALDLKRQMDEEERKFNGQKKKWDKELGKTLQRLANMANNKPLDEGVEKEGGEKNEEEAAS
jgi:hypothetical protein